MPSPNFASERCVPWLYSQAEVRPEGEPTQVAPGVHAIRARHRLRSAFWARFLGLVAIVGGLVSAMAAARPGRDPGTPQVTARPAIAAGLGGLGLGAFALARRLDQGAPALAILSASRGADLSVCAELVAGARRGLVDRSWPEGQVWIVSEAPLSAALHDQARGLGVRCFTPIAGRIAEV